MFKTSMLFPILMLAVLSQGCVMSSTHEALQAKYAQSQDLLATCNQKTTDLESAIAALELEKDRLTGLKTKLERQLSDLLSDKSNLEASVADMQAALTELERRKAEADARIAEYKAFLQKFQTLVDEGKLKVKIRDGKMVIELATDVLFASGKADLSENGGIAVREVSRVLQTIADREFQIEGHTDNKPLRRDGKYESNWDLAAARAITVVMTMVDEGMPATKVSAASFGDSKPTSTNDTEQGRTLNRRIEIVVVPDLSSLPGFNELQNM